MRLKLTKQWWQMGWLVVLSLYSSGMTYAADVPPDYFYAYQNNTITVEGTVTGSDGMPVAGATITIKGQNEGTVTDADGRFYNQSRRRCHTCHFLRRICKCRGKKRRVS